jgi:two-component system OmpR family response regulator
MPADIVIIEDDPETAAAIAAVVRDLGHLPRLAGDLAEGLRQATAPGCGLVILDRMLPDGDGINAIARLRLAGVQAMVLVVSALGRSSNRIEGLQKGADDYLAKPFDPLELRARIQALLRRAASEAADHDLLVFDDLEIRLKARTVHRGQSHIALSPREFELLVFFAENEGAAVSRAQLLARVWNLHFDPQTNVVDVHVSRLRRKLEDGGRPALIHTLRGLGYVFRIARPGGHDDAAAAPEAHP